MNKLQKIDAGVAAGRTVLGVGPVTKATLDAAIDVVNATEFPLMLIPSRRQIECKSQGGGYLGGGMTTEDFAAYVEQKDVGHNIILMRDHGGVGQGKYEDRLSPEESVEAAKESFKCDIESGFEALHVDSSVLRQKELVAKQTLHLLEYCRSLSESVVYQVNFKKHGLDHAISPYEITDFLKEHGDKNIKFVSGNVGLFVFKDENAGIIDEDSLQFYVNGARQNGALYVQHNCDYIDKIKLLSLRSAGTPVINIAPEYGVIETNILINFMKERKMNDELSKFVKICVDSKKWEKWFEKETGATDLHKTKVCGHYNFDNDLVLGLREKYPELGEQIRQMLYWTMRSQLALLGWS